MGDVMKDKMDSFGNRMKSYEQMETERHFLPFLPVYARIDGRGFSKFTKGMNRPYDERMVRTMVETTKSLVDKTNARIGYTQSDEISMAWLVENPKSQMFFNGKIQKMTSVLASLTTALFTNHMMKNGLEDFADRLPHFDCRVFQLPSKVEAANTFLWREQDAAKNAISMAAYHYYSHSELQNKSGSEKQEMLFQKGVNFNDYPAFFKRGTFVRRETYLVDAPKDIPAQYRPTEPCVRHHVVELDMPRFNKVTNREGVIFDGENPLCEYVA